ncbi:MAG: hypothetical protein ACT4PZ_04740 [Panacagrimonas sp.]
MLNVSLSLAQWTRLSVLALAVAGLSACNDDDSLREGDGHQHEESSEGRLVVGRADGANSKAVVYDLSENEVVSDLALAHEPSAVYSSPDNRYAVVLQAAGGQVNFIDGGIFAHEDHIDVEAPSLLSLVLTGTKPAHYRPHEELAALFYDGEGTNNATIQVFSDESLGTGTLEAQQSLPAPVHGIAEARGDYVLSIDYTAEEFATGATRTAVRLYERHGDHYHAEQRFETPCLNLHGGASNDAYSAFGCTDGVLVIEQAGTTFVDTKVLTPERISQVAGHPDVADFAAFAGDGTLYAIDPSAKTATEVDWSAGATASDGSPVNRLQHTFDGHAEHLLILDNTGTLHVLEAGDFSRRGSVKVLNSVATGATGPRIAVSVADDRAYINDAAEQAVVVVDLEALEVVGHVELGFAPVGVTWVGAAAHAH